MKKEFRQQPIEKAMSVIVGNTEVDDKELDELRQDESWKKFINRLVRQFILTFFFGFTGIPMLWRTSKHYGIFMLCLFVVSTVLTFLFKFWYLYIILGWMWFVDIVTCIMRIRYYVIGRRTHMQTVSDEINENTDNARENVADKSE